MHTQPHASEHRTKEPTKAKPVLDARAVIKQLDALLIEAAERDGIVHFSRRLCAELLEHTNFIGQRVIRAGRWENLLRLMRSGEWNPPESIVTFAQTPDGHYYNVNGQHRLIAGLNHDGLTTRVNIIQLPDLDAVARAYARFDSPESVRTDQEAMNGMRIAERLGVSRELIRHGFRAMAIVRNDMSPVMNTRDGDKARYRMGRLDDLANWDTQLRELQDILHATKPPHVIKQKLLGAGAMAVLLTVLKYQPAKAVEFITGLAGGTNLRRGDPRHSLLRDFNNKRYPKNAQWHAIYRVMLAWNAFYKGEALLSFRYFDDTPITLRGTPIKDGRG